MSNNRELSQFGNYISVNTNEIVGINTDLIISGIITAISYYGDGSNLTGIATVSIGATLGLTTITELNVTGITSLTNLTVSGISTFGNIVLDPVGIITASAGVVTYYGDGQYLQNILSGVGVATESGLVGTGATILDFRGAGISTVTVASGIATINITSGAGLYVNKYGDNMFAGLGVTIGSLSSPSIYFNGYTNSGFYSPSDNEFGVVVSGTERLNVNAGGINVVGVVTATTLSSTNLNSTNVNVVGVVTATSFKGSAQVGVATGGTYIGLATQFNFVGSGVSVTHDYDANVGIATVNFFVEAAGGGGSGQFNTGITSSVGYLVTGSMATAYTASDTAVVHSIHVTNIDGTNSADISGQLYGGQYSIAYTVPVPAGSSVELLKQPKVLNTGDTIQLEASATNDLHATITLEPKTGDTTYIGVGTDITSAATYTDLWVATADSVLQGILLSNDDGATDVKARVVWTDGADNIVGYYTYDLIIPADATVEVLEQPKFLPSGYKVRVYANQANRLEAILSARTIA